MCDPNPLLLREKQGVGVSLPIVCHYAGGVVYGGSASACPTHFIVTVFSLTQCVGVVRLLSGFCSVVIASCIAVHSIYIWLKVSSGAFYIAILVHPQL